MDDQDSYGDGYGDDPTPTDPYPDAPAGKGINGVSDLARLSAIADTDTRRGVVLAIDGVPGRENVQLRFQVGDLNGEKLRRWQQVAGKRRRDKDVDGFLFNSLLIANTCEGILVGGDEMRDADGDPITFRTTELMREMGVPTADQAARRFIGSDGVIGSMSERIMAEAGFGATVDPDPTSERG